MSIKAKLAATAALTAVITAGLATPAVAAPAHPIAVAPAVAASSSTVTEAQWLADVSSAIAPARAYVEQRTAEPTGENLAIVFDIDNTTLATHFHPFAMSGIAPVVQLAQYAESRGVSLIFVTARPDFIDLATRISLGRAGYTVDGLHGRDLDDLFEPVQQFKTDQRIKVENQGYTIIANIGNNWTDLNGGHAERTFKLPDYNGLLS
ncbi:HAD family acid phosphatase [Kitasatospora atroaurantiaca]|uniref:Putative secreted acid phosphatase n=1 Tax=Kitasatospora atroaurantiaca TaxID=285545 RepID=A0A561F0V4_9ACTN|nr:HAD family acid phosphatase [Kitasatospora atroaurantiaca]TWE21432.1 putative secreted acid phosphatase [Kitasatospora atroaurantiaca]